MSGMYREELARSNTSIATAELITMVRSCWEEALAVLLGRILPSPIPARPSPLGHSYFLSLLRRVQDSQFTLWASFPPENAISRQS